MTHVIQQHALIVKYIFLDYKEKLIENTPTSLVQPSLYVFHPEDVDDGDSVLSQSGFAVNSFQS